MSRFLDADGDGQPDVAPDTKVSPKVYAAALWGFLAPMLIVALAALLSYLLTDDGRALFAALPIWVQVPLFAFVAALSAGVAGYLKRDPLRALGAAKQRELTAAAGEQLLSPAARADGNGTPETRAADLKAARDTPRD